jgi:hypothetical protein
MTKEASNVFLIGDVLLLPAKFDTYALHHDVGWKSPSEQFSQKCATTKNTSAGALQYNNCYQRLCR